MRPSSLGLGPATVRACADRHFCSCGSWTRQCMGWALYEHCLLFLLVNLTRAPCPLLRELPQLDRMRLYSSREELEAIDLEREMELQLVEENTIVERVVAERITDTQAGTPEYLIKWQGLPYCESTWERAEVVLEAENGPAEVER